MKSIPSRIKRIGGGIFLVFGLILIGFAIGGLTGLLDDKNTLGEESTDISLNPPKTAKGSIATFAAGCFWCTEAAFQEEPGVLDAVSGFAGGTQSNPTYDQVVGGKTDYREGVQVTYNPEEVSYERLIEVFRESIDPVDAGGQYVDRGFQYTTAIFFHDQDQKQAAERSFTNTQRLYDEPLAPLILPFTTFYPAEAYHQDFYKNSKQRYEQYKSTSGRENKENKERRIKNPKAESIQNIQGVQHVSRTSDGFTKPSQEDLKEQLSFMQYRVTQNDGTEPPFANAYWDNEEDGIYVDIVSGEPLFSSKDMFDSGTGRPSFTQPIGGDLGVVTFHEDSGLFSPRTEVRSAVADSHLGHLFDDGPVDAGGLRYCMNSASMRFIAYDDMDGEGYGDWMEYVK